MSNIALFIDGDNASPIKFRKVYDDILLKGNLNIRRLYTDIFKEPKKWKEILIDLSIELVHVNNLPMKESSDMMEVLFTQSHIDTFFIVSTVPSCLS